TASEMVSDWSADVCSSDRRFRGRRLVHTHLRGEPLTRDDLVDLVRLRLDLVAAIQLTPGGEPRAMVYAHNVPADDGAPPYREVEIGRASCRERAGRLCARR